MIITGVVEDIQDPLKIGRVRVRIFGRHTDNRADIPTESLPWALCEFPVNSASVSGIGVSPTGLVRGSWVTLDFLDQEEQYPIVKGVLPGIPRNPYSTAPNLEETVIAPYKDSGVVDGSGVPVVSGDGSPVTTTTDTTTPASSTLTGARRASDFPSISQKGLDIIKSSEGLKLNVYQDSVGVWTIGYGTTYINGAPVNSRTPSISQSQAEAYLLSDVNSKFLPAVHSNVKAMVTQSMVDALVSFAYNVGAGNLKKSTLLSELNGEKYESAATRFLDWNKAGGKELAGLTTRRKKEKDLFLSEGVPSATGELTPTEQSNTPVAEPSAPGNTTSGSNSGVVTNRATQSLGFNDPNGKYPLYRNEPDSNRLARNEKIKDTSVYRKEIARKTGIRKAGKVADTWSQSSVPYNASYPNNKVYATESGHILEFDDTANSRRINLFHAAGSFIEIDDNGTQVNRIVGDGYQILERNGYVYVAGAKHVSIGGSMTSSIGGAMTIDVDGDANIRVFNNANIEVSGDLKASVKGKMIGKVGGDIIAKSGGNVAIDATFIFLNCGESDDADSLPDPDAVKSTSEPEFSELNVITRGTESGMQYETPDEGDPTQLINTRLQNGEITKDDLKPAEAKQTETPPENTAKPTATDCGEIHTMTSFPPNYVLSPHFTIGKMNKNGERAIVAQAGLKPDQIACNLKMLCLNALEPIYDLYPSMIITSGFRRPGDVAASSKTSDHYTGSAADIQIPGFSRKEYYEAAKKIQQLIPFHQLLLEYNGSSTWIHVSYKTSGNAKTIFTMNNHSRIGKIGEFVLI